MVSSTKPAALPIGIATPPPLAAAVVATFRAKLCSAAADAVRKAVLEEVTTMEAAKKLPALVAPLTFKLSVFIELADTVDREAVPCRLALPLTVSADAIDILLADKSATPAPPAWE